MKEPPTPDLPPADAPRTGGFASHPIEDLDYAIQVVHEMEGKLRARNLGLRHEPELGWPEGHRSRKARNK